MEKITLAENLKKLSKKSSLRKIAQASGVAASSLSNWQNGQIPSGSAGYTGLRKLCAYLKCSVETLMHGDIDAPSKENLSLSDFFQDGQVFSGRFIIDVKIKKIPDGKV